jgi:hypothetical protein
MVAVSCSSVELPQEVEHAFIPPLTRPNVPQGQPQFELQRTIPALRLAEIVACRLMRSLL